MLFACSTVAEISVLPQLWQFCVHSIKFIIGTECSICM